MWKGVVKWLLVRMLCGTRVGEFGLGMVCEGGLEGGGVVFSLISSPINPPPGFFKIHPTR